MISQLTNGRYNTVEGINELKVLAERAASTAYPPIQGLDQTTGDDSAPHAQAPETTASQQLAAQQDPFAEEFNPSIPAEGEEDDGPPPSERGIRHIHDLQERQNAYQNKENRAPRSFLSRQPDARRVDFDDPSQPTGSTARRSGMLSSPSQDSGFQTQADVPQRDRDVPPSRKRRRDGDPERLTPSRRPLQPVRLTTATRPAQEPLDREDEETRDIQEYAIVSQMAREVTRAQQVQNGRKPRKPWSEREVAFLTRYIEEYGCSWALILRKDKDGPNVFQDRDQYALKDKARNMRFDYEKSVTYPLIVGVVLTARPELRGLFLQTSSTSRSNQLRRGHWRAARFSCTAILELRAYGAQGV